MGYQFSETGKWYKQAFGSFFTSVFAFVSLMITAKQIVGIESIILLIGAIPVIGGIIHGVHYMNRPNLDYIYLTADALEINKGPLVPPKSILYRDIDHCDEFHDYDRIIVTVVLIGNKEVKFHGEWLRGDDFAEIKQELIKRTGNEKLFRYRVDSKMI